MEKTINDKRANRDNDIKGYRELCHDVVKEQLGIDKEFGGCTMTYDTFKSTAWKHNYKDIQVDVRIDFNAHTITITTK